MKGFATRPVLTRQGWAWVSVAGVVYYVGVVAALHVLEPDFNPIESFISDYVNGRHPWLTTSTFAALALLIGAINLALKPTLPRGRLTAVGRSFLWAGVLGVIGAGLFPADPVDPPETVNGILHIVAGLVAFPSLAVGLVCISIAAVRVPEWKDRGRLLLVLAILFVATFLLMMGPLFGRGFGGLGQRLLFAWLFSWVLVGARHVIRRVPPAVYKASDGAS